MRGQSATLRLILLSLLMAVTVAGCSLLEEGEPADVVPDDSTDGGTVILRVETEPSGQAGTFLFTGVPSGTISVDSSLVVTDLDPGTYTVTEADPAPDFDVTAARCDDGDSATPSVADPQTRTAIFNVDAGETVTCIYTNTQRGVVVVALETIPDDMPGSFRFTGVPTGTVPGNGTLVTANLRPGTYTATEVDPAPLFDLVIARCDDDGSATPSLADPVTRSAIFNVDPGEMVTCTFINARRGTLILSAEVNVAGEHGPFQFTGVPSGTISAGGELVVENLVPGTYTSTEVDPEPDYELVEVACDDSAAGIPSTGDANTRSAIFNLEAGETVRCVFSHSVFTGTVGGGNIGGPPTDAVNPFDDPDSDLSDFPLPDELPSDAGSYLAPKPGPWTVDNLSGRMDCGITALDIPPSPPETGLIEVLDGGQTLIGSSLQDDQTASVTMFADPGIVGRYTGAFDGIEEGVPVTINYVWQVVTDEYVVGYLTSSFTSEGVACTVYRPYVLTYAGQ